MIAPLQLEGWQVERLEVEPGLDRRHAYDRDPLALDGRTGPPRVGGGGHDEQPGPSPRAAELGHRQGFVVRVLGGPDGHELHAHGRACISGRRAAWPERAALRELGEVGRLATDLVKPAARPGRPNGRQGLE